MAAISTSDYHTSVRKIDTVDTLFTTWVNTLFVLQINAKQQNKHTNIKKKKGGIFGSSAENV